MGARERKRSGMRKLPEVIELTHASFNPWHLRFMPTSSHAKDDQHRRTTMKHTLPYLTFSASWNKIAHRFLLYRSLPKNIGHFITKIEHNVYCISPKL